MRVTLERILALSGSAGNTSRRLVTILMAAVLAAIWAAAALSVATDRSRIINSAELEIRGATRF